ncbi:MAG TPA: SDR family NAD(P)-dependent oxidoreductase [Thermomicrobiales bacterium]|jgi:3-oxoacyl-[acyl-carrier protein] reductase|nr:SDR family NAD(P)-dependent oxidoreductase [Thermomicrobiales bacterium]
MTTVTVDCTGDVVFVTGGATGIGFGIARLFHATGASVVIGDIRQETLDTARATLGDDRTRFLPVDVRDPEQVAAFVRDGEAAFGPATVMVANAGVYPNTAVLDMDPAEFDRVMETNVRGVFLACQAAGRSMVANGTRGKIVTIASGAYNSGRRGASHYCASKAAVVMFTKVLAMELGEHHINVNCVSPGLIELSDAMSPITEEYRDALLASIPWGRVGQPDDIAKAVLYLCSPAAEWISGAVLSVDGGSSTGRTHLPFSSLQEPRS